MKVYIAGPYTAPDDTGKLANTQRGMAMGLHLMREGHVPFMPHLTHFFDLWIESQTGARLDPAVYYQYDLEWLDSCDAILMLKGWEASKGATAEYEYAQEHGIQIYMEGEL